MSNWVGVLIALAILTLAAVIAVPAFVEGGAPVGRYQLLQGSSGTVYRIDTTTGDTWVSVGGTDWHLIGEEDEGTDQPAQVSARPIVGRRIGSSLAYARRQRSEPKPLLLLLPEGR